MFGMDPSIAAAMPDLQLAQAMMQQGLSTAPASPWEALARVAQAGAGQVVRSGALSDLAKAYANSADNMAQVFDKTAGPGNIVSQMLRSQDPMVRAQGMQLAQKAGLQVNESNPTLAQLKAKAEAEGGAGLSPSGPSAPPAVPINPPRVGVPSAPSAAIAQPPQMPTRNNPLPRGTDITGIEVENQPPPATFDQRFNAGNSRLAQAKGNIAGAEANAKNQAEFGDLLKPQGPLQPGPGTTEPIKSASGTMIPALKDQGPIPNNPAQLKEALPAWQKTVDQWNASLAPAQTAVQRLTSIENALKEIQSGTWTTNKAAFAGMLKSAGIDPTKIGFDDPKNAQLILHENVVETLDQLKQANPRFAQSEFKVLTVNKEHPDQQPGANLQMLAEDLGQLKQAQDLPNDFTAAKAHGWVNPQSFEQAWLKQNPLSGYVQREKARIGPLKGMPGFTPQAGAVAPGGAVVHWERGPDGKPRPVAQ